MCGKVAPIGCATLSSALGSGQAIDVNIAISRVLIHMPQLILSYAELAKS
jgi:hypothetical protein